MTVPRRTDAGAAVAGLFDRPSTTGGLAGRAAEPPIPQQVRADRAVLVRQGVELSEEQIGFLRGLSRPARTGQPRTLGSKFVATGVLIAAIELLQRVDVDMYGVAAGDRDEVSARARAALERAASTATSEGDSHVADPD
jgi:hypothetical protein